MNDLDKALYYLSNATNVNGCFICHLEPAGTGYCITTGGRSIHRLVYKELVNDNCDGIILHSCDNRNCINPKHLKLGTQKDNMQDMIAKGRKADTTGNCRALTPEMVDEVLCLHKQGLSQRAIGNKFNVSQGTISNVLLGHRGYADVQRS